MTLIKTERLILRPWKLDNDLKPFSEMNGDPRVREYFPSILTEEESNSSVYAFMKHFDQHGWGLWAVSVVNSADFIGFIGLQTVDFETPFTPAVEIGWRLAYDFWNKGYATEGAQAALNFGFNTLKLPEIVSFTTANNFRSMAVMQKIGMHHNIEDDFNHPKLPENHPLSRHVLYRLNSANWKKFSQ